MCENCIGSCRNLGRPPGSCLVMQSSKEGLVQFAGALLNHTASKLHVPLTYLEPLRQFWPNNRASSSIFILENPALFFFQGFGPHRYTCNSQAMFASLTAHSASWSSLSAPQLEHHTYSTPPYTQTPTKETML